MKINKIPIVDTGHGYDTPGKRSDGFEKDGIVLLKENSVNEAVGNKLSLIHHLYGDECHFISNEWNDITLDERVKRERAIAKEIASRGLESFFISIHADAFHIKDKVDGGRFYYYSDSGKEIADILTKELRENNYGIRLRDPMQKNFKVIRETASPAVLFELGFMTTYTDLIKLLDDTFRNDTAIKLYNAFKCL